MNCARLKVCAAVISVASLSTLLSSTSRGATDPNTGKDLFLRRCSGCHSLDTDKEGPRLRGVFGRKAGSVAGFQYSDELRKSGILWDEATLGRWLEDTQRVVPANDMEFRVINATERAALIAYLKSLTGRP